MLHTAAIDMTEGKESHLIIRFAWPLLMGNLLQQLYNLADTAIVGKKLGDDALAAVGATGSVTYCFIRSVLVLRPARAFWSRSFSARDFCSGCVRPSGTLRW